MTGNIKKKTQKVEDILHAGRLGNFSQSAAKYTSSIDIDQKLTRAVIQVNTAHVIMLAKQGIVDEQRASKLIAALTSLPRNLVLKEYLEDVHMNVEDKVISSVGREIGGMLNLAKSRNDQVATALRIALREDLLKLGNSLLNILKSILEQALRHSTSVMPGYTHLQRAQPITLGAHLLAHFDALDRDFARLVDCYHRVNACPMGAGALAGSSFELDREFVCKLLGFDSLVENTLDAVSSRDFATEAIYVCAQIMVDLSRIAEEVIIWTTKEFSFAEISDQFSSTSSMMPQKKNAIVPEIARARASQVLADLVGALGIERSLPLSYNLDLQELTRNLWSATEKSIASLAVNAEMISKMKFNEKILFDASSEDHFLFATELADYLVRERGLSFRDSHGKVGSLVRATAYAKNKQFTVLDESKISEILGIKMTMAELAIITEPQKLLARRRSTGYPNPKLVRRACVARQSVLKNHASAICSLSQKLERSDSILRKYSESFKSYGGNSNLLQTNRSSQRREKHRIRIFKESGR